MYHFSADAAALNEIDTQINVIRDQRSLLELPKSNGVAALPPNGLLAPAEALRYQTLSCLLHFAPFGSE